MAESKQTRIKRPDSSIDTSEFQETQEDISKINGKKGSFQTLCNQKMVKEGMRVVFKNKELPEVPLTYEQTGQEQTWKAKLAPGIIVKGEEGDFAIFTTVTALEDELKFRGRFARTNYERTLTNEIVKAIEKHLLGIHVEIVTGKEYVYYFNENMFFVDYFFRYSLRRNIFLKDWCFIDSYSKTLRNLRFNPLQVDFNSGDVGIRLIPNQAKCEIMTARQVETTKPMTFLLGPYQHYIAI
ncbi:MAG: hypothetical protein IJ215_01025 [Clostridia bacterium]|nr:hypothetical protein [Clostridia bacterium]